jgi:hypothetical protein
MDDPQAAPRHHLKILAGPFVNPLRDPPPRIEAPVQFEAPRIFRTGRLAPNQKVSLIVAQDARRQSAVYFANGVPLRPRQASVLAVIGIQDSSADPNATHVPQHSTFNHQSS